MPPKKKTAGKKAGGKKGGTKKKAAEFATAEEDCLQFGLRHQDIVHTPLGLTAKVLGVKYEASSPHPYCWGLLTEGGPLSTRRAWRTNTPLYLCTDIGGGARQLPPRACAYPALRSEAESAPMLLAGRTKVIGEALGRI